MPDSEERRRPHSATRREFLKQSAMAVAAPGIAAGGLAASAGQTGRPQAAPRKKPNIVLYIADQFRWDFVGATV